MVNRRGRQYKREICCRRPRNKTRLTLPRTPKPPGAKGMFRRMTVPEIVGVACAIVAAALAIVVLVQRRRLRQLTEAAQTAHQAAGEPAPAGADPARAMLA